MSASIHTLGCRVNQYESQLLAERLSDLPGPVDVHVVNTCTVTALADRKSRQLVRRLTREHPGALVVAVGCGADGAGERLRAAGADLVVGNRDKARLRALLETYLSTAETQRTRRTSSWVLNSRPRGDEPSPQHSSADSASLRWISATAGECLEALGTGESLFAGEWRPLDEERVQGPVPRARALLKVQDGCTQGCAFCRAWQVRGPLRSKSPAAARAEAEALARAGHQEIVLVGINLAQYGEDLPEQPSLADLLRDLLHVDGVRFRLSSFNPEGVTDELIAMFAQDKRLCPYLHLPLQSGDDAVLGRMGRPYTVAEYEERARAFLDAVPRATLGADVMVGFPGEDEAAFGRTVEVLAALTPLNVHIFRFSPRAGTPAARFTPWVSAAESAQRAARLADLAAGWSRVAQERFLGAVVEVVVEDAGGETSGGRSENYLPVEVRGGDAPRGTIVAVRLVEAADGHLVGVMVDRAENG
ncbi:MAG: MiaB/RimO family radical SAM methylthiotransferase [Candidatus Bipolaricaulota bacterium]